jgi:hypothetical protein
MSHLGTGLPGNNEGRWFEIAALQAVPVEVDLNAVLDRIVFLVDGSRPAHYEQGLTGGSPRDPH